LCSALCLGLGLIIVSTFASFYWELYERTVLYDEGSNLALVVDPVDPVVDPVDPVVDPVDPVVNPAVNVLLASENGHPSGLFFDNCGEVAPSAGSDLIHLDSHWAFVFRFNAVFYTVVTGMVVCSCTGLIYTKIFNATLNCLIAAMFVHVAAIVLAGVFRFNANGVKCSENAVVYDANGNSWETDALLSR